MTSGLAPFRGVAELLVDRPDAVCKVDGDQGTLPEVSCSLGINRAGVLHAMERAEQLFQASRQQNLPESWILA